ncbi:hypothetical protein FXO37_27273 [Capsicum annuum]|nr:hypothetical protein FXO37_27273 [Capsicum annuum]
MKFKKKFNIDTKLAGKGIRYDPNFLVSDDDFEDLTNRDVQLKNLKNVYATPSRITRSQGKLLGDLSMAEQKKSAKKRQIQMCQLSVHINCGIVTALKFKLDMKQLDLFKNSCFGRAYKEVKSAFFDIRQEQLTKKVSSMEKFMKSSFELIFRALDIKNEPKLATSIGNNNGNNSKEKDDETPNVGGIGNDQVDDLPNVGKQNIVAQKVDHISDNLMDDVDANESGNVKGIKKNMVVASVMLDETPAIPCRLRKPATVCKSPFLSKFDSGCGKVEGQSYKRVQNAQPSNRVLSIKHPFMKSITERIDDMKVTLQCNRVDTVKMKEWFFTLAYPGVPLTDSGLWCIYCCFVEYLLDGFDISSHLEDVDAIQIRYGVLLWNYEKKKQRQCAVSEDESTGRLLKKSDDLESCFTILAMVNEEVACHYESILSAIGQDKGSKILGDANDETRKKQVISGEEYDKMSTCETTKEIWDKLKVTYERTTKVKKLKFAALINEYELFKMEENENIETVFVIFRPPSPLKDLSALSVERKDTNPTTVGTVLEECVFGILKEAPLTHKDARPIGYLNKINLLILQECVRRNYIKGM